MSALAVPQSVTVTVAPLNACPDCPEPRIVIGEAQYINDELVKVKDTFPSLDSGRCGSIQSISLEADPVAQVLFCNKFTNSFRNASAVDSPTPNQIDTVAEWVNNTPNTLTFIAFIGAGTGELSGSVTLLPGASTGLLASPIGALPGTYDVEFGARDSAGNPLAQSVIIPGVTVV